MFDGAEYSSGSECFTNNNQQNDALTSSSSSKKKKSKNKIRFSDEQIRSLEVMFESETKLDPRKKIQLAKDLGLQPRQVAIWFQNKRARWKSKQIEKDYSVLLADYNNLASQFDNLKKENQSLLTQLQQLKNEMLDEHEEKENHCQIQETGGNNNSNSSSDGEESNDCKKKMEFDNDTMNNVIIGSRCFEDDNNSNSSIKAEFLGSLDDENDHELLAMAADSSLTSVDEWGSLESDDLMHHHHHPTQSCQWWDFWS